MTGPRNGERAAGSLGLSLGLALALILVLRIVALWFNRTDLFFDEAQYWSWGLEPAFGYYSKPPLVAWIIRVSTELCGTSEFCVRLPSPLIHTATAIVLYWLGRRLAGPAAGFWASLTFATLPGVSFSASLMSTDVPLLLAWAVALLALSILLTGRSWWPAIVLGLAIGVGLNAKYAMAFFGGCLAVYLVATPEQRGFMKDGRLWLAISIAAALITPNMLWNQANSFATFSHTADNANWAGRLPSPLRLVEFLGAQAGVFGPILVGALIALIVRAWREGLPAVERLLLAFTLPVIALISVQAFLSRAHANWAATAYVAGSVLVPATLVRLGREGWLKASLWLHLAIAAIIGITLAFAGEFKLPGIPDPFARTLGWKATAETTAHNLVRGAAEGKPFAAVVTDERAATAELLYYRRDISYLVYAWRAGPRPLDHYELTRPWRPGTEPLLLVSLRSEAEPILSRFEKVELVEEAAIPTGRHATRRVRFYRLSGYRPSAVPTQPKR
ncbi:MAG TPA: glycosyltransferase family 39 protein [Hyphomicrobiaceae bacterium]|nr:glycosyltransferase family 39 protein [Hyphomicrobiaceae bacterium]